MKHHLKVKNKPERYQLKINWSEKTPKQEKLLFEQRADNTIAMVAIILAENKLGGNKKPKQEIVGITRCQLCLNDLNFTIKTNGHVWGKCQTEGCLQWAM